MKPSRDDQQLIEVGPIHMPTVRTLFAEDDPQKYREVVSALAENQTHRLSITNAKTVVAAERQLSTGFELLLLDISMNISSGSLGPMRGGHANLGGMDILERLYLIDQTVPTIIVTGFAVFQPHAGYGDFDLIGLNEITDRARTLLGKDLLGAVSFGKTGWKDSLLTCLSGLNQ